MDKYGEEKASSPCWLWITIDVLPGSRSKPYDEQVKMVRALKGYDIPKLREVVIATLMQYVDKGERALGDNPLTFTRCEEECEDPVEEKNYHVCAGGFQQKDGFRIGIYAKDGDAVGMAAMKRFFPEDAILSGIQQKDAAAKTPDLLLNSDNPNRS
ncbi:MAG: hypothetical protein JSR58_02095 [Verrucomicrobia bacterium]|nr:hypothetical protein [Verrucomicrobiota bacterium]